MTFIAKSLYRMQQRKYYYVRLFQNYFYRKKLYFFVEIYLQNPYELVIANLLMK